MGHPLRAYSLLGNLQNQSRMDTVASNYNLTKDVTKEARDEEKKRIKREKNTGFGRLLGTGTSLLASLLLAPVTGGLSIAAQAAIAGGTAGLASAGGQWATGGFNKVKTGKFNIAEDKAAEDRHKGSLLSNVLSDTLVGTIGGATKGIANAKRTKDVAKVAKPTIGDIFNEANYTPNAVNNINPWYDWTKINNLNERIRSNNYGL